MKKILGLVILIAILSACNMPTNETTTTVVATETGMYAQPLPTDSIEQIKQLFATPTGTPFQPTENTPVPVGSISVLGRWENEYAIIIDTTVNITNTDRQTNLQFQLVSDDIVMQSGPLPIGLSRYSCQPQTTCQFKIGGVVVFEAKKEGNTVTPYIDILIP